MGARLDGSTTTCRPLPRVKASERRRSTENSLAEAGNDQPSGAAAMPPSKARRPITAAASEDAFEQAALAPRDGRRGAAGRLARRLRVPQALLLLGGIEHDAGGRCLLPEDQAVDEALVAVVEGLGVLVHPAADVGIDAALGGLGDQRLLRTRGAGGGAGARAGDALLGAAGERRRQRLLGLVGRRHFLRTGLARARRTQFGVGRHGERRVRDDLEFVGRDLLAATQVLEGTAPAERQARHGGAEHQEVCASHHPSFAAPLLSIGSYVRKNGPHQGARCLSPIRESISIKPTPITMAESATLKAGQCHWPMWKSAKSNTAPQRSRSITLPMAPPMTRPMPQPVSVRSVRRSHMKRPIQTATAIADRSHAGSAPSPASRPKLTPRFHTITSRKKPSITGAAAPAFTR